MSGYVDEDSDKLESDSDDCKVVASVVAASTYNLSGMKPNKKIFKKYYWRSSNLKVLN